MSTLNPADIVEEVGYLVSSIRDPERASTLEQLDITHSDRIVVTQGNYTLVEVYLKPTNPACHLVQQIALSIHLKLEENMVDFNRIKLVIRLEPGSHNDIEGVEKQVNDKERVAAALENEEIRKFVKGLIDF